jgi:predicted SprT family Zn-dependent metalloprotease
VGVETYGYKVKEFQSRWGSCTPRGRVDFNWKIIMAPNRVLDYVVVNELCHLKQHGQSYVIAIKGEAYANYMMEIDETVCTSVSIVQQ